MFLGPTIVFSAFKNEGHEFYYFVLILGTIFCLMAVYLLYSGIMTIVKRLSEEENNNFKRWLKSDFQMAMNSVMVKE